MKLSEEEEYQQYLAQKYSKCVLFEDGNCKHDGETKKCLHGAIMTAAAWVEEMDIEL